MAASLSGQRKNYLDICLNGCCRPAVRCEKTAGLDQLVRLLGKSGRGDSVSLRTGVGDDKRGSYFKANNRGQAPLNGCCRG